MALKNYGDVDGLTDRLREWSRKISSKEIPHWPGTGVLADIETACRLIEGEAIEPRVADPRQTTLEYDL